MRCAVIFLALAACAPEERTPTECEEMLANLYAGNLNESEIGLAQQEYRQKCVIEESHG